MRPVSDYHPHSVNFTIYQLIRSPLDQPETEQRQETVDANGIRTIVEYISNDDGKKVKVRDDLH
jgi:hypothetical protein